MAKSKRKHQQPAADQGDAYEPLPGEDGGVDFNPDEFAAPPAAPGTSGAAPSQEAAANAPGEWEERTRRPDPFDSITVAWQGGYRIRYQEKENALPRRSFAEIRFGGGSLKDKPLNFDKIKERMSAAGLTFIPEDRAWGMAFTRHTRGDVSDHVKAVFRAVVKLEEEVRGPHEGERAADRGIGP
jgi:hypothetical protein